MVNGRIPPPGYDVGLGGEAWVVAIPVDREEWVVEPESIEVVFTD